MAAMKPDPARIKAFKAAAAFEAWMSRHHAREDELWLRIFKKDSGRATVTYDEALDVALCWGWIDGIRKSHDEDSFLQRFTPRRARSAWSARNVGHVERLVKEGRMTPHGMKEVDAARADGRWDAAYEGSAKVEMPADLVAAISANRRALATYKKLNAANRFALAYRTLSLKTEEGRRKRIKAFVAMLASGKTPYPNP